MGKSWNSEKVKSFYEDKSTSDFGDWLFQVNMYRYLLEKKDMK